MKPKTMILMGLAIVCGLGASYMTSRLLADRAPEEKETVEVLVAKRPLNIGERIVKPEEFFEKKTILKADDSQDAIRDFEQVKDKILKQSRNKGDTITAANMYGKGENLDIPKGHLAIGLRVNQETTAGNLASLPGSRVDLVWFQRGKENELSRSDVLLEDIYVLAADGKIDRDGLTATAQVVTLALTPDQNIRVNMAKETGIVSFALRRFGDDGKTAVRGISGQELRDEIARRIRSTSQSREQQPADAGPPSTEAKAALVLPEAHAKAPMAGQKSQSADTPATQKTTTQELTVIRNGSIERITREIAEDGSIVKETRKNEPLPAVKPSASKNSPEV
jgi:Flp pilus assembly protein CpaB